MTEYKEAVRAIIENAEREVLLGRRARGIGGGLYALVGGKPDPGETYEEAIIREVQEELGITIKPVFYKKMIDTTSDPKQPWLTIYFIAKLEGDPVPNQDEIVDIIYVQVDDLDEIEIAFDHKERLLEYFNDQQRALP